MINEKLTNKIRAAFSGVPAVEEKKMFSGIAFMVYGKLCISVGNERIMCRIDPAIHSELIKKHGCTTVIMKGSEYIGYVHINESALKTKKQIDYWVQLALDFNPKAKATIKKKSAGKK